MLRIALCIFLISCCGSCGSEPTLGELYREAAQTSDYSKVGAKLARLDEKERQEQADKPPKTNCPFGASAIWEVQGTRTVKRYIKYTCVFPFRF
jgi:hypothetical protein